MEVIYIREIYIPELKKFVDREFAREYYAKKKHENSTNTQILEKLDKIIELLADIKNEIKGGGLLEGNTGRVKAQDRNSEAGTEQTGGANKSG